MNRPDGFSRPVPGSGSQSIDALAFDAPGPPAARALKLDDDPGSPVSSRSDLQNKPGAHWWHSQFNLMLSVFGLLVVAAVLFVMLAPPPPEIDQAAITAAVNAPGNSTIPAAEAPWNENQRAQARRESQAILSKLLISKNSLEKKDVLLWAPARYQQALEVAVQGDNFYEQQNFVEAISNYRSAVDQMRRLSDLLPTIISTRLAEASAAINAGKSALARELFESVLRLDQTNIAAKSGLDRAKKLDQVLSLIAAAELSEADFIASGKLDDLQSAEQKLLQAQALDADFKPVSAGLKRVQSAIVEKRFQAEMSRAYQALFANRYNSARKAFAAALQIKPGDPLAASAMQQSLASDKTSSLGSLITDAQSYEDREEWASAESNYQTVLQRDPNQLGAKLGNIRAGARKQLDTQLSELLADTLLLGNAETKTQAARVLADAKALRNKGPRLLRQIDQLEKSLKQSEVSIKVNLVSDSLTDVSLQRVGSKVISLGQFSDKNLSLKPGRYIVRGARLGYQDVRIEIELYAGKQGIRSFLIRCDQPISRPTGGGSS